MGAGPARELVEQVGIKVLGHSASPPFTRLMCYDILPFNTRQPEVISSVKYVMWEQFRCHP